MSSLTPHEQQVMALACQDLNKDEIAWHLSTSRYTVKALLQSSIKKVGLKGKVQLLRDLKDWDFSA